MSIGALVTADLTNESERAESQQKIAVVRRSPSWNAEEFAKQQIRGLVRQVFFGDVQKPVRQVMIGAIERETDVPSISGQIADALARETSARIAVAGSSATSQDLDLFPDSS